MTINKVGVIGSGLMGSGIAEQSARCGFDVVVREINPEAVEAGQKRIFGSMTRGLERGKMTQEAHDEAVARLSFTTEVEALADCDIIIEAATENMALKKEIFADLDRLAKADAILATNTSSLSIAEIAAATSRPDKVLGIHFFNPVPVMPLIEYVRGLLTSDETMAAARQFGADLGKQTVESQDRPGFIVNRLLIPYALDAIRILEEGVATRDDIDLGIKLGLAHPMGPLTLSDFVGLDTLLFIADAMYDEFKDPRYAAPPLLRRMVTAGYHGRKTGKGFYDYS
ncbi:MAG: 3-hydroxybutyryl-CoA dehydrogenase [Ardenticatenales bacterium]|nr:3-hydroxybutyryl-CoA dehydrogenase [Ardenticatenales bacterium]